MNSLRGMFPPSVPPAQPYPVEQTALPTLGLQPHDVNWLTRLDFLAPQQMQALRTAAPPTNLSTALYANHASYQFDVLLRADAAFLNNVYQSAQVGINSVYTIQPALLNYARQARAEVEQLQQDFDSLLAVEAVPDFAPRHLMSQGRLSELQPFIDMVQAYRPRHNHAGLPNHPTTDRPEHCAAMECLYYSTHFQHDAPAVHLPGPPPHPTPTPRLTAIGRGHKVCLDRPFVVLVLRGSWHATDLRHPRSPPSFAASASALSPQSTRSSAWRGQQALYPQRRDACRVLPMDGALPVRGLVGAGFLERHSHIE